ncbi:cytidine deaminase [Emydomyces testavorans]|uniref:Cytidine deaminase n=1 Tax=Emydomyces testavorans TaxID=2070801 RepID=A0AAF0DHB1_9EURO|nr:cytidine deaminase [Emydomyces testavorans]
MSSGPLTESELSTLSTKAIAAKEASYCPYSKFRVGASLLTEDGKYFIGANVENASYPVGICAEKCVVGTAVAAGYRKFKAIAVATDISPPATPCGNCRQFIREFCAPSVPIYMYDKDGNFVVQTIGELLPGAFGPSDMTHC